MPETLSSRVTENKSNALHISSLLLRADPDLMDVALDSIRAMPGVEVPLTDPSGKIVVTLETRSEADIVSTLNELNLVDGVASAALIYHQVED